MQGQDMYQDPRVSFIAIGGGPCAGKSTMMSVTGQRLEDAGMRVIKIEESATKLINRGFSPFADWKDPRAFQKHVLVSILNAEREAYDAARDLPTVKHSVFLCDRGALDGIAYVGRETFEKTADELGLSVGKLMSHYKMAIHLVTAADGAEEFFTLANNAARSETPEQARSLDKKTLAAWHGHPSLRIIDNSTGFDEKIRRAFNELARKLNMPEAFEIERKFVVHNLNDLRIPSDAQRVRITQDYLVSSTPGVARRVRKRELDGVATYYYTEKRDTDVPGKRLENERQIPQLEYKQLLKEKDPALQTIVKDRITWSYESRYLELDLYQEPLDLRWLHVLEVEVPDINAEIKLPPELNCTDVTGDKRYDNYALASGSLKHHQKDPIFS